MLAGWLVCALAAWAWAHFGGPLPFLLAPMLTLALSRAFDGPLAEWRHGRAMGQCVLGVGLGLWWADAAAALVVSLSILRDGVNNLRGSIGGLTDAEARTYDGKEPHPLTRQVEVVSEQQHWVGEARARVRDEGHVFHLEMFVVPVGGAAPTVQQIAELRDRLDELDWKLHDIVIAPVPELPPTQTFRSTLTT